MALGTVYGFESTANLLGKERYNFETDQFRFYLLDDAVTDINFAATTPAFGDFNLTAVSGNYTGTFILTSQVWLRSGGTSTLQGDDLSLLADPSNPTTAKSLLLVNNTDSGNPIQVWDLTTDNGVTPIDLVNNNFTFDISTNDILSISKV